ncbi:MAG: hypothetical protein WDA75_09255, partial [Candidatus Latescibacterota bacterium]
MKARRWTACLTAALAVWTGGSADAQATTPATNAGRDPLAEGQIYNIVDWEGGPLPRRYERSDQLPLTLEDVRRLSQSRFSGKSIVKMLEERRCACDASVDALIGLKEAGVAEEVLQAVSLHSLRPNRSVYLAITVDFEGLGGNAAVSGQARRGYLYLIVPDGDRERVFFGNLAEILARRTQTAEAVDNTDLLLPRQVRRVLLSAEVPLKVAGPKKALVFTSTRPNIYSSADIPEADRAGV